MTIGLVKVGGWAVNEKLKSTDQTLLDLHASYALDRRSGQPDTCASTITCTGPWTWNATALFNQPVTVSGTSLLLDPTSTLSVHNTATFTGSSAVLFQSTPTCTNGLTLSTAGSLTCGQPAVFNDTVALNGATTASTFTMSGTNRVQLGSRSLTRTVGTLFVPGIATSWSLADSTGTWQTTSSAFQIAFVGLALPVGVTVTQVRVWIEPASGHVGQPMSLPFVQLWVKNPSLGGAGSLVGAQPDVWSSIPLYEQVHAITLSGLSYTANRVNQRLTIQIATESGTNALAGFKVHGADITFTTTFMDDGPVN